jgi:hypothetical protein
LSDVIWFWLSQLMSTKRESSICNKVRTYFFWAKHTGGWGWGVGWTSYILHNVANNIYWTYLTHYETVSKGTIYFFDRWIWTSLPYFGVSMQDGQLTKWNGWKMVRLFTWDIGEKQSVFYYCNQSSKSVLPPPQPHPLNFG